MSPTQNQKHPSLDRREFLKAGSIAAVGLALPASLLHAAAPGDPLPILSVGYAADIPEKIGTGIRLHSAKDLLFGDPLFLRNSARLRIGTFSRFARYADLPASVDVQIVFPSYGFAAADYPEVHAWQFRQATGVGSASQSVAMTVPVTSTEGLQLLFRRPKTTRGRAVASGAPAPEKSTSTLRLDTGVGSNVLKLQRGAYVVALRETDNEREPNWDAQVLVRGDHGLRLNSSGTFTHLILTIDYATW